MSYDSKDLFMLLFAEFLEILQTHKDPLIILLHACLQLVNDASHVIGIAFPEIV